MQNPTARNIGPRIREIRQDRGLSLRVVSGLAGISVGYLSMIETEERPLEKRSTLEAIARALRVSPTALGAPPQSGVLDPQDVRALDALADVEAALTDVALGEKTVTSRPWPAVAADVDRLHNELRPRSDVAAQMELLPQLIGELNALLVDEPQRRRQILQSLIHVLHTAAMGAKYVGASGTPGLAALQMREVAEALDGEVRYLGLARFARSQTLASGGRQRMLELSESAADELQPHISTDEPARQLYGMLHLNAALAAAVEGRADVSTAHLREARETANGVPDFSGVGWANLSFNRTNVDFWSCTLWIELGDPGRVVHELSEAIHPERVVAMSRQGAYWVDLGRALSMEKGRRDDAVRAMLQAEACAPVSTRRNVWARDTVRGLLHRVNRDSRAGRDLRGLAYRMGFAA